MLRRPGQIEDDRGCSHILLNPAGASSWPLRERRVWIISRQLSVALRRPWGWQLLYGIVNILLIVLALLLGAFIAAVVGWGHPFFWLLVCLIVGHLMLRSFIARLIRPATAELTELLLREGLCAACGYNLHGIEHHDGGIICPECGATWNASRIHRTMPFNPVGTESQSAAHFIDPSLWNAWPVPAGRDDRRSRVPLVHPRLRDVLAGAPEKETNGLHRLRRRLSKRGRIVRMSLAMLFLLVGTAMTIAVFIHAAQWGASALAMLMFPLGLLAFGVTLINGDHIVPRRWIIRCMKEEGLCPSCANDLSSVATDADGCRICPLCFAAWRLDTVPSRSPVVATPQ